MSAARIAVTREAFGELDMMQREARELLNLAAAAYQLVGGVAGSPDDDGDDVAAARGVLARLVERLEVLAGDPPSVDGR